MANIQEISNADVIATPSYAKINTYCSHCGERNIIVLKVDEYNVYKELKQESEGK
jgi:hypothetical protein